MNLRNRVINLDVSLLNIHLSEYTPVNLNDLFKFCSL